MAAELHYEREMVHALVDALSEEKLAAVRGLLEVMVDVEPLSVSLAKAPIDEEELRPEFIAELEAAHKSVAEGKGISHSEILREFGLAD